jgi:copper(I)-binding protein
MDSIARRIIVRMVLLMLAASIMVFAACEGGPPKVSIEGARAELSPAMRDEGLVYLKIINAGGSDMLTGIKPGIPGAIADLHEMKGAIMVVTKAMRIPKEGMVELKPMGSHIMIENMPKEVKEGYRFTLTLLFKRSGEIQVPLEFMKAQEQHMTHEHHM